MAELGIVLAKPSLCLKVVASLPMRNLQVVSDRIVSLRRYSRLGVSTWLIIYLICLSVIVFLPNRFLVMKTLLYINCFWYFLLPELSCYTPNIRTGVPFLQPRMVVLSIETPELKSVVLPLMISSYDFSEFIWMSFMS